MVYQLARLQCDGSHSHQHLQGGLPAKAQEFPRGLVKAFLDGMRWARNHGFHAFNGPSTEEEEQLGEDEGESSELGSTFPTPAPQTPSPARLRQASVTDKQKDPNGAYANTRSSPGTVT